MSNQAQLDEDVRLPPRWFIRAAWAVHRGLYRITGGRFGLRRPRNDRWGMLRLTTIGRRSGLERSVIIAYYEDGPNLVAMAMNGWGEGEPAWWLNLQARPEAHVQLPDGRRAVRARAAQGEERVRLGTAGTNWTKTMWTLTQHFGRVRPP